MNKNIKNIIGRLFSTRSAGMYMLLFAIAIGTATFIENDFGTSAAFKLVYAAWWFELLLLLFGLSILVNIFRFRLIQQRKWAVFSFHAAILVILVGAAISRYTGYEGMMHIREGESSNSIYSATEHLVFEAKAGEQTFGFSEPILLSSLGRNHFKESYLINGQEVAVELTDFLPNPKEELTSAPDGKPTLKIVIGGANGREEYYISQGQRSRIRGTLFNFTETYEPSAFNLQMRAEQIVFTAPRTYFQTVMATQQKDTMIAGLQYPLQLRSLYSDGQRQFVFGAYDPKGVVAVVSSDRKMNSNSLAGIKMRVSSNGESQEQYIYGSKGIVGRPKVFSVGDLRLAIAYGAKEIDLPFSLALRDFILERYPGTNSASSYASEVTLLDGRKNINQDSRIFMNNILNYGGYRFFQSSFDQDEKGTWLSVNHDRWGTWVTYLGYALLTIGMVLNFFHKNSRFQQLSRNVAKLQAKQALVPLIVGLLFSTSLVQATPTTIPANSTINAAHAQQFGKVVIQDHRGRMKPMNTYASEILRKLSRKSSLHGWSAEQVILGMAAQPKSWYNRPLIKMGRHDKTKALLPAPKDGNLLAYSDFFEADGSYKLQAFVRQAYNTPKKDRGVFEKEMLKLDEKVNICSMVFGGSFMKAFPIPNDPNHTWEAPGGGHQHQHADSVHQHDIADEFYQAYMMAIRQANWQEADQLLLQLYDYQHKTAAAVMLSDTKRNAELLLNSINIFSRLGKVYGLLGLFFLGLMFTAVFQPSWNLQWPARIGMAVFVLAFSAHLFGLGLRWYVSGRAPWSNGYESMIYIAFTTVLSGLIFSRKSIGGMTATNILASTILMVAGLSWLDPEITPLVPVLRSYWLTIHVSLEAGSYGFLMLGALIGALNLLFMIFRTQKNAPKVNRMIREMSQISEMTLIGGLVMVSIGTYLGGVWANESWGRYWGWDAKETWALVTILVYAFILHMRFIPGLRGDYAFNVASLFGWASVIMTYFGVNYYLSGLHSYAAGDPVPVPNFVYYAVAILGAISVLAYWRNRQYERQAKA